MNSIRKSFEHFILHRSVEVSALQQPAIQDVRLKRSQKLQCPANADAKRLNARFEAFEIPTLENAHQSLLTAFFELVNLNTRFLESLKIVWGQLQMFDA